jgi:hypothetical protein
LAVGLAFLFALLAGLPAALARNKEIPAAAPARTNTKGNLLLEEVENRIQKFLRGLICSSFDVLAKERGTPPLSFLKLKFYSSIILKDEMVMIFVPSASITVPFTVTLLPTISMTSSPSSFSAIS